MPKSKKEYEKIRAEAREKILCKAIDVFSDKGYSAANISDIAEAANISVGLIYRYFSSKQELFETLINNAVAGLRGLTEAFSSDGHPKEIMEAVCRELLEELDNEVFINLNIMVIQGLISKNDAAYESIVRHDKDMFDAAAALIKRGQDDGVFSCGDPLVKSMMFFSAIQGLSMMKFFFKQEAKTPNLRDLLAFLY